jgi:hypothetical protein
MSTNHGKVTTLRLILISGNIPPVLLLSLLGLEVNVRYITKRIVSELSRPRLRSYDMPVGFQVHFRTPNNLTKGKSKLIII